jgi:ubiquinone/menaquinone biosynthesis C-methylase UbiE
MAAKTQYEKIGSDFITGQKEYFSKKPDHARVFIASQIPDLKGKTVLDAGCGHGVDIVKYESLGAKEVFGIDISEFMIDEAKKIVKEPSKLFVASMEKMPLKDNSVDVIIGRFSLHYLVNPDVAYKEFARILKKNGILIMVTHHPIKSFVQTGAKDYLNSETIKMNLYNKVTIQFPHHTFKEFFSDEFFKHFSILYMDEENAKDPEYPTKENVPGYIAFKAIKKV